jgi:hypothetical protein
MLFASLIKRIVGSKLTNRVRFSKFIDDYPKLFNYIRDILTKAKISNSTNNGSILPALCLLSKLNPTHIESKSRWQESVELLDPILFIATSSRNEIARRMAAKAFIPVSESSNGQISLSDLFSNLHGNSNNLNFIFGLLTVVRTVLNHRCPPRPDTQAEQGDNPSVATDSVDCKYATESASVASELLNEFSGRCNWLLRHQCIPIRALCYQMLFETVYDRRWCSPTLMNSPSLDETMRSLAMKILDDKCDSMDVIALHQLQKYRSLITMASAAYQHEGCCLRHLTALVSDNSQSYEARVSVLERLRMARSFMNFVDEKQFTVFILQFARDTLDQCKSLVGWESAASRLALKSCLRLIIELFQRGGLMQDVDTFVFDYRCCWQLISSTEFGLELRALAVELLGYLVDKESSSMDNWLDVVNLYSVETAALDLRSACVRSIKPVIGRCLFSLSAEQTYRLLVDCIARRLLQDDNDLIREECALLISKAFRECCTDSCIRRPYLSPDSAVKAIFEYILRIPRDPSGATILVRCMINTLIDADNRLAAITRLSNGQLFNNEKANVMKDELMDVRLTIQCLEKLVHSEPPVCRRESSLFELLACRLSELRDGGNLYGLRDAQMLEMRCDYLQQAASL